MKNLHNYKTKLNWIKMWKPLGKKTVGEQDTDKVPKNHPKDSLLLTKVKVYV